ncbi:proteasome regulatory particle subunit [Lineolata rhizophorae]|uniref:Proteasome regulatory particle subunit n=1 Tax=Lineolata rhizophorae TaxID=578093 RepID=A0A6A6PC62_9PEZI|nr:proteasome regulatory particle subunit [Lineolata rhizophorae]
MPYTRLPGKERVSSVVESLINANPKLANRRDEDDRLPLHWAVSYNRLPIVQLLVQTKGFEIDAQDGVGWTPLMMAVSLKDADEILDLLLQRGADVNMKNNNGQTALHFTASKNNLDAAKKLISGRASARIKDKRGQLALHRAAAVGSVPMIKLLLENKSPLNATDMDGLTALHHAIAEGHGDAAMELLKAGAETEKRSSDGHLAIEMAPDQKIRSFILQSAEREGIDFA